jgi:TolB-like protein
MKNLFLSTFLLLLATWCTAQNPRLAVISFDVTNTTLPNTDLTELLRIEIAKHNRYEIVDRYEIADVLQKENISVGTCYSKSCLINAGKSLGVDYMLSGSADKLGDALYLRARLFNLKSGSMEKEVVREFLFIPEKINTMLSICINDLVGVENDKMIVTSLSNIESYESAINNPYYQTLDLSGPRMGYSFITGNSADILRRSKLNGGFDAAPYYFQIGYQFEKQYLSEGKWQALVEFLPVISGVDQGLFIPSISILNGIRSNKTGVEFAIGPTFAAVKKADVYLQDGKWLVADINNPPKDIEVFSRLDSRGKLQINSSVVIAAGFSLRSGKLNIPINAYVSPSRNDLRFGVSFGFNTRK